MSKLYNFFRYGLYGDLEPFKDSNIKPENPKTNYDNLELEKGDFLALVIAAFQVFLPPMLVVIGVFVLIILLFTGGK